MNTDPRSDDEINRIIAEWCGWSNVREGFGEVIRYAGTESEVTISGLPIPNYTGDLNACHEAEGRLSSEDQMKAAVYVYSNHMPKGATASWTMYHATARQRAEALVKVIEKEASHV